MSEHDRSSELAGRPPTHPVHGESVSEPMSNPGLPEHRNRLTDIDAKAAGRAERQVAALFALAALALIAFCIGYLMLPLNSANDPLHRVQASNLVLGGTLGLAMLAIGVGAIHWAKKLMPDVEVINERHPLRSSPDDQRGAVEAFRVGAEESGIGRRPFIAGTLLGALALLPLPAVVLLGDLGPLPRRNRYSTIWEAGVRVVNDLTFEPIRPEDMHIGQLVNCMPENFEELPHEGPARQNARAEVPVILVRMEPEEISVPEGREDWGVEGILCYSKICTHVGCPINLYEQVTHNLLCPCHQSTFNLADGGRVVFGPAARDLPQLALDVDAEGYLVAQGDFTEPVGPSFWERG